MTFAGGALIILTGLTIMSFGLFLFYALLPLLFGLVGFDIGVLVGKWLTGEVGWFAIGLGLVSAIALGIASYSLEPYRRILLGISGGVLVGLSLAAGLGIDGWLWGSFGFALDLACGLIGSIVVLHFFDFFVIVASAFSGASLAVAGAHVVFPNVALFHPTGGGVWPRVLIIILAVIGCSWQFKNIAKWVRMLPMGQDNSAQTPFGGGSR
jgi:hypothetical protein